MLTLKRLLLGLALLLFALAPGLQAQEAAEPALIPEGETVKIGVVVDLSSSIVSSGLDIAQAATLAVEQFNTENEGILGFTVEALIEDDLCDSEAALEVAEVFLEDPTLVAVLGHTCSGASIPASELYEEARIPMVSASSTAGLFTARDLDVTNRVVFNDNLQGLVAARVIAEVLEAETIVIIHNGTAYGEGIAATVAETFTDLDGEVLAVEVVARDQSNFEDLVAAVADLGPDLIYFAGYSAEGSLLVDSLRAEAALDDTIIFSADGLYNQDFLDFAGPASEGTYITFGIQQGDPEAYETFVSQYEEFFGIRPQELGNYHSQAYDAANIIMLALAEVAELDGEGNLLIDREALIAAIRATADYPGLSGNITCDENGDCASVQMAVFQVQEGAWVEIPVPDELQPGAE